MSTPCCRSLRSNRLVVSEYEVPKVWFHQEWIGFFLKHPLFKTPKSTLSTNREQGTATNPRLIRDYKPRPGKILYFLTIWGQKLDPR